MLDRNLDAYRIVAEILEGMREQIHRALSKRHGEDWHRSGLPADVLQRLIDRKEKEKTIDWYDSEYQQLIDFATFADFLEVLTAEPDLVPGIRKLAPNHPLLHARLLELDVLREKLALARPISESELSFLGTFYLRYRKAVSTEAEEEERSAPPPEPEPETEPAPEAEPEAETPPPEDEGAKAAKPAKPKPPPVEPVKPPPKPEVKADGAPAEDVAAALDAGDDIKVLRALYREVIDLAEGLWTAEVPAEPTVWEHVSVSPWYARSFSAIGLQPVADFYEIFDKVREMMDDGLASDEVQGFLKDRSFATVLLSLRDMFQQHGV